MMLCSSVSAILFLSTPSARRATRQGIITHLHKHDFYPRPPRGGRRRLFRLVSQRDTISIHALREEGDSLSTAKVLWISISIHALREEGDQSSAKKPANSLNFYPRPPRGGRRLQTIWVCLPKSFLSTPSARRATRQQGKKRHSSQFLSTPSARRATCMDGAG